MIIFTVAEMTSSGIKIALIPHTLENTILSEYRIDQNVNIELDMVGKYIESFSNYHDIFKIPTAPASEGHNFKKLNSETWSEAAQDMYVKF